MNMDDAIRIVEELLEYAVYNDMLQEDIEETQEAIDYLKTLPVLEEPLTKARISKN